MYIIVSIDDSLIRDLLGTLVLGTGEDTLSSMLYTKTDQVCRTSGYDPSADHKDIRAAHYKRKLHTKAVKLKFKMTKLRKQTFETTIYERY